MRRLGPLVAWALLAVACGSGGSGGASPDASVDGPAYDGAGGHTLDGNAGESGSQACPCGAAFTACPPSRPCVIAVATESACAGDVCCGAAAECAEGGTDDGGGGDGGTGQDSGGDAGVPDAAEGGAIKDAKDDVEDAKPDVRDGGVDGSKDAGDAKDAAADAANDAAKDAPEDAAEDTKGAD